MAGILLVIGPPMWVFFAEEPSFAAYLAAGVLISAAWIWLGYSIRAGRNERTAGS